MTDEDFNEVFARVIAKADRDTVLLIGEFHSRLAQANHAKEMFKTRALKNVGLDDPNRGV